ncbi:MAG: FAD-dependent oxidoreductase [Xanthobacteraceae bacterium]
MPETRRGGATGVQLASIFNALGSKVQLFQAGPRILPTEDEDVSAAVAAAFRSAGIAVREGFGTIESFEKTPSGVRMVFSKEDTRDSAEAAGAFVAAGWVTPTPPGSIWRGQASKPMRGAMCAWTPRCGLLRRTSTQRATSPAA